MDSRDIKTELCTEYNLVGLNDTTGPIILRVKVKKTANRT